MLCMVLWIHAQLLSSTTLYICTLYALYTHAPGRITYHMYYSVLYKHVLLCVVYNVMHITRSQNVNNVCDVHVKDGVTITAATTNKGYLPTFIAINANTQFTCFYSTQYYDHIFYVVLLYFQMLEPPSYIVLDSLV